VLYFGGKLTEILLRMIKHFAGDKQISVRKKAPLSTFIGRIALYTTNCMKMEHS
jgi:hypothetical protein